MTDTGLGLPPSIEYKKLDLEKDEDGEERGEIYYAGAGRVCGV